jgi:phosphopantothenoylcysteine decarboxylase/phosphopantothenate--cysteine ligase
VIDRSSAPPARRVLLGVAGGIAAYKAAGLVRLLAEAGHHVTVVPTEAALRFVGAATFEALSGNPIATDVWTGVAEVRHVRLGQTADLVVVAPATADLLARAAAGMADDLLTASLLVARCPVLFAPAMHTEMWEHPATRANVRTLRERGAVVLDPAVGRLTGPDSGPGRLPEPAAIAAVADRLLARGEPGRGGPGPDSGTDLAGRRVVVTAGGTREYLDPVRFLGNASSGKQGYAFAVTAAARGARVTLVAANTALADPAGVDVVRVTSTEEMHKAVLAAADGADAVVMAAAPADFRPAAYSTRKIKKSADGAAPVLELVRTVDIAAEIGARKPAGQVLVAFAAETHDALANARGKLAAKNADLIVVNDVSGGRIFGADRNAATVLAAGGAAYEVPECSKEDLADAVWDVVLGLLPS